MAANSRTWFYTEPEHRPYYIEERVNQNLWATRFGGIYLDCVQAEAPFRMEGVWHNTKITIEWVPNDWFTLTTDKEAKDLIVGFTQILQFSPAVSYTSDEVFIAEWRRKDAAKRLLEIKGHAQYTNIKTYKR